MSSSCEHANKPNQLQNDPADRPVSCPPLFRSAQRWGYWWVGREHQRGSCVALRVTHVHGMEWGMPAEAPLLCTVVARLSRGVGRRVVVRHLSAFFPGKSVGPFLQQPRYRPRQRLNISGNLSRVGTRFVFDGL